MPRQPSIRLFPVLIAAMFACGSACSVTAQEAENSATTSGQSEPGHDEPEHSGDNGHGEDTAGGVPISFDRDLALWSLIVFVLFLFVLRKLAWRPMIEGLDKRESRIRRAIAEAEENQRKAEARLAEYEDKLRSAEQTVAGMVAEAKRDAERTSQDLIAKAQAEVEAIRERARDDIAQAKDTALAEVFGTINAQVAAAAEHVLGRALSDDDQNRLIQEALSEIGVS